MGLDIYFYKVKDRKSWQDYVMAVTAYDKFTDSLWKKYKAKAEAAYNKWNDWHENLINKLENKEITDIEFSIEIEKSPYDYKVTDFASPEEYETYSLLEAECDMAEKTCQKTELANLYMRKQYWFIQYCYNKFQNYLIFNDDYKAMVLDNENHYYDMILMKNDISYIIDKLTDIVNKSSTGEIDRTYFDSVFLIYQEYVHFARPDWNYKYDTIKYYLDEFKKTYDEMSDEEIIWVHEWW